MTVARVTRAHGLTGAVLLTVIAADGGSRLRRQGRYRLSLGAQTLAVAPDVQSSSGQTAIARLLPLASRCEAERWQGALLQVPSSERPCLQGGSFYVDDLLGLRCHDEHGTELGRVVDVWHYPANDVWVLHGDHGELLVPATHEHVLGVDFASGLITLRGILP